MPIKHFEYFSSIGKPVVFLCSRGKMGLQQVWLSYNQLFNLFFFFLFLCQLTCLNAQLCTQEQSSALLQFKRNFSFNKSASLDCEDYYGITSFPKMKSWKKGSDCCSWDGVDCDGTGQVIGLDLSCSWLQGTIHPNSSLFLSFPHLQKLNLACNDFFMSRIPPEFTRFTELTHLNLSWSGFSGKVPLGVSFLNKLVSLDLSYNSGLGLEEGGFQLLIQNLSKLRDLDLSGVNISSSVFLNSLLNLTSLRTLGLGGSGLRGEVLPGVFYLNKLVSLDLSGNFDLRLEEGVFELLFQNLSKLRYLNLMDINMSSLVVPKSLLNLTSLRTLLLGGSGLHGEFPSGIFHLPHLRDLEIWGEEGLTGYIPDFINLTYPLQTLILLNTSISGILPDSIANLKSLEELILSYCNFQGSIPTSFWTLPQIRHIQLDSNNFSGILPSSISNLTQITHLGLSFNHFSGVLPSSISNITNLAYLYLFNNNFTGPFFSWDVNLPKLQILDVSNNCLTGPLPSQVIVPPNLFGLSIGQNLINGTIPSWVFELPTLKYLDLSYNQLIGRTLEFQSSWLESIDLSNNYLHGTIPNSTFELQYLTDLILSSNRFSGTIPKSNRFSGYLKLLELQMNNFSGTIPDSFSMRNPLKTINLHGNGFEGPIPKSLVNCTNLEVLDLGRNKFLDKFPRWLGSLPNLRVLILHSNKFHGSILASTRTKFPFPMLRVLDMSNNNFTGPLPTEYFKSFKAMMNVDEVHFYLEYLSSRHASFKWNVYYDSLTMVIKGSTMEMEKILTIFTVIDLSSNKFEGEIPKSIGVLNSIRGLNLSHNNLTGAIPKSLGNMTKLEWLDLSSNNLTGEIPQQLTNLTSLGMLNLSHNRLMGPIPRGKQFDTFLNDSYINNSALCGPPLSNTCGDPKATQPPPSTFEEEDSEPVSGFGWEVILPGYGFGLVVGLVMGYLMFSFGKPLWLVMMVEGVGNRNVKRQKSNARRRGGRRN